MKFELQLLGRMKEQEGGAQLPFRYSIALEDSLKKKRYNFLSFLCIYMYSDTFCVCVPVLKNRKPFQSIHSLLFEKICQYLEKTLYH